MRIPKDYTERVYAGVLGKIIGVYLGRPFEGWPHARIIKELGEIQYYVHERLNKPLIVVDDDISGTFAFLRAMPDYGNTLELTATQIGQTWLNYLIENKTVLWWGGLGMSTEHTAYLRLKRGIQAPKSGSAELNSRIVAEQIGAQIFIDGWGMISPGDPEQAADLARRAASVSHDGEAIHGAQVIAAMEAQAFCESDIGRLLDVGLSVIPSDCLIRRLICDLQEWHARYATWQEGLEQIVAHYGYDKYGGNCHMVPNHALIILAILYCEDSFAKAMTIVNTAGWDTDCNSGNVGCLMGIKNGLAGLDIGPDLRTPVADRMYIPTADGGNTVTDAAHEALQVAEIGHALADEPFTWPKTGARFHFALPGAVQGFICDDSIDSQGVARLENVCGHSKTGQRSLAIHYRGISSGRRARIVRETFPVLSQSGSYSVAACPTIYPGQTLAAHLEADAGNARPVEASLLVKAHGADDQLFMIRGAASSPAPGQSTTLQWTIDVPVGCPIAWVGIELSSDVRADGTAYLDWLDWSGEAQVDLRQPDHNGTMWLHSWVQACSALHAGRDQAYRLIQNEGTGLCIKGTRQWRDYVVSATLWPHLVEDCGIAARVQGLRRYYALKLVRGGRVQLVRELDGSHILAERAFAWDWDQPYELQLAVQGRRLSARINGEELFEVRDESALTSGAMALLLTEGRMDCDCVRVRPAG